MVVRITQIKPEEWFLRYFIAKCIVLASQGRIYPGSHGPPHAKVGEREKRSTRQLTLAETEKI